MELLDSFLSNDDRFVSCNRQKKFLKKIVGLTIFQTSVFLLYITFGKIKGGTPPILNESINTIYSNPLPHVLILTAIVVGVQQQLWDCL